MKKQKKNLLVTLADENYIDQAKQLFSSVYWNAGWKGDYMLLAHEIPEKKLKWFRDKGILIKKCKPIFKIKDNDFGRWSPTVFSKFYLFTSYFKKWKNIIFLDADIIVRASLDELTRVKGFAAVGGLKLSELSLKNAHIKPEKINKKIYNKFKKNYNLNEPEFNTGMMAFSTNMIRKDFFSKLIKLFKFYNKISSVAEEIEFNLLFYKKWIKLPKTYNINPYNLIHFNNIEPQKVKGIVLHFQGYQPWNSKNYFYKEWKYNLKKAELIDLKKSPTHHEIWTKQEMQKYELYLKKKYSRFRHTIWKIRIFSDKTLGLIGIFLKKYHPKLYFKLRKLKIKFKLGICPSYEENF